MGIRSDKAIYQKIEQYMQATTKPLTCNDLMEHDDVRQAAIEAYGKDITRTNERVSDALGLMWRKGLLTRYPAPRTSRSLARYAYMWEVKKEKIDPIPNIMTTRKQGFVVREHEGGIVIEFEKFMVYIQPK